MAIPLTKEQQQAIDSAGSTPSEVVDPRTSAAYVLIPADEYEVVREVLIEERRQKAIRKVTLRNAAGRIQEVPGGTATTQERRRYESEPEDDDLEPEYDFSGAVRGKYYERYQQGTNVVLLDADVARAFKDSEAVNRALRLLLDLAKQEVPQSR
jgi:hypothetical protein